MNCLIRHASWLIGRFLVKGDGKTCWERLKGKSCNGEVAEFGETVYYKFPTTDVLSAIALAETFTTLVLGTLQDASQLLAKNGDDGPVRAVASVIGQEGEQNGFYRTLLGLKPSQKPFLTTFSNGDPITRGGDKYMQSRIPGAKGMPHITLKGGHFLQEDAGTEFANAVNALLWRQ